MSFQTINQVFSEARDTKGPLTETERAAAAVLCDLAIRSGIPDVHTAARQALDACGLLRKGTP